MIDSDPTTTAATWHEDPAQVLGFARILTAAGALESAPDALDYIASPGKYDAEHDLWTRSGRPHPPSTDAIVQARALGLNSPQAITLRQQHRAASTTWDAFRDLVEAYHHTGAALRAP
jgi:hypothetical protein